MILVDDFVISVQVMRTHGFHPTEEELTDMIRNVDTNANGAIDFNEFIDMMVKRDSRIEDDVAHAFKVELNENLGFRPFFA
jgi:Ca2+-binding EF-hand superfamily protein